MTLDRDDYWQCAYVIPKGEFDAIRQAGLPAFRNDIESAAPFLHGRTDELKTWDDIKLLSVAVDGFGSGHDRAFCASGIPHTRCLPSEASASIWLFRTRLRPQTFSPNRYRGSGHGGATPRGAKAPGISPRV